MRLPFVTERKQKKVLRSVQTIFHHETSKKQKRKKVINIMVLAWTRAEENKHLNKIQTENKKST